MKDLTGKIAYDRIPADDWNQLPAELQNFIISNGLSLSGLDIQQAVKSLAAYSGRSDHYTGGGTADVQTCTPHDTLFAPLAYNTGMRIRWTPSVANATTTPTVNVNGLGAKTVVSNTGGALEVGDLATTKQATAVYDGTDFRLRLFKPVDAPVLLDEVFITTPDDDIRLVFNDWPATYNTLRLELDAMEPDIPRALALVPIDNGIPSPDGDTQAHGSRLAGTEVAVQSALGWVVPPPSGMDDPYSDAVVDIVSHPGVGYSASLQTGFMSGSSTIAIENVVSVINPGLIRLDGFQLVFTVVTDDFVNGRFRMWGVDRV